MSWVRAFAALVWVAALSAHASASAANGEAPQPTATVEPLRVELDVTPPNSPLVPLLRAELGQLGLEVVDSAADSAPAIAIHVSFTSDSLEVRIVNTATGRVTGREAFSVAEGRKMDPRTAALHAIEYLRWHLRSLASNEVKPVHDARTPVAPPIHTEPRPAPSDLRIALLPIALYSPGGTRVGLGGELDLLRRFRTFGLRLVGAGSLVSNSLEISEGSIDASARWGGLQGVLLLDVGQAGTSLELGAGAALFGTTLSGAGYGQNLGQSDHLFTLAPLGDLRVHQRIVQGFGLTLASGCLFPLYTSRLRALQREVGRYGQAVVTLGLGVELTL